VIGKPKNHLIFENFFLANFCQKNKGCVGHTWNVKSNGIMLFSSSPIWKENILLHLVEVGN
jgi:hypothetical protein